MTKKGKKRALPEGVPRKTAGRPSAEAVKQKRQKQTSNANKTRELAKREAALAADRDALATREAAWQEKVAAEKAELLREQKALFRQQKSFEREKKAFAAKVARDEAKTDAKAAEIAAAEQQLQENNKEWQDTLGSPADLPEDEAKELTAALNNLAPKQGELLTKQQSRCILLLYFELLRTGRTPRQALDLVSICLLYCTVVMFRILSVCKRPLDFSALYCAVPYRNVLTKNSSLTQITLLAPGFLDAPRLTAKGLRCTEGVEPTSHNDGNTRRREGCCKSGTGQAVCVYD